MLRGSRWRRGHSDVCALRIPFNARPRRDLYVRAFNTNWFCQAEHERELIAFAGAERRFLLRFIGRFDNLAKLAGAITAEGFFKSLLDSTFLRVACNHPTPSA